MLWFHLGWLVQTYSDTFLIDTQITKPGHKAVHWLNLRVLNNAVSAVYVARHYMRRKAEDEWWAGKDFEEDCHGLYESTILAFVWRE
jgi:hypothetical protein